MLVLVPGDVVHAVHVSPVSDIGEIFLGDNIPSMGREFLVTTLELGMLNTAATSSGLVKHHFAITGESRLRERIDSGVILFVILLSIGGNVPFLLSPSIFGSSPSTVSLDSDVVGATADAEETFLTPVGTPGVTYEPVLLTVLLTVTNDGDIVNNVLVTSIIAVDTTSVFLKSFWDSNTASNGTTLSDLLHHVLFTGNFTEFIDTIDKVLVGDDTGLTGAAVTANVHGRALLTVVKTASTVDGASLISDLVVGHPLEGVVSLTTVATLILSLARDDDLGGDVDIGPGTLTGDLDGIGKGRGGSVSPA
jgi:hypothetical protein